MVRYKERDLEPPYIPDPEERAYRGTFFVDVEQRIRVDEDGHVQIPDEYTYDFEDWDIRYWRDFDAEDLPEGLHITGEDICEPVTISELLEDKLDDVKVTAQIPMQAGDYLMSCSVSVNYVVDVLYYEADSRQKFSEPEYTVEDVALSPDTVVIHVYSCDRI